MCWKIGEYVLVLTKFSKELPNKGNHDIYFCKNIIMMGKNEV